MPNNGVFTHLPTSAQITNGQMGKYLTNVPTSFKSGHMGKSSFNEETMNSPYETAKHWVGEYVPILPVRFMTKKAMVDWKEFQERLPTDTELRTWFHSSIMNLGLVVGNGLVVIDFDFMPAFEYWLSGFEAKYPDGTYMVKTRRGVHVYVHTEERATNYHSTLLDIKAERGYVLIPPSVHPSGFEYQVLKDRPVLHVERLDDVLGSEWMPAPERIEQVERPKYERLNDPWAEAFEASETQTVDEIRSRVSILDLMPDAEPSDRSGRWYVTLCPFHDDNNPSFWIDLERGMCGCRKCNIKEMDSINLFARLNGISNQEAIRELSKR